MLPAQVSYWTLQEQKRHNVATEHQQASELVETHRHNVVTEEQARENISLGWANLAETQRHNVAFEQETKRHNVATENLGWRNLEETSRHNLVTEQQNIIKLSTDKLNAVTNRLNAGVNQQNANTRVQELAVAQANANTNRLNAFTNQYAQTTQANAAWNNSVTNRNKYGLEAAYTPFYATAKSTELQIQQSNSIINGFSSLLNAAGSIGKAVGRR